jgi:hypothetical protein
MRDFRDGKAMAQTVRAALAAKGLKITTSESLELIAKAFGLPDWNTLSAAIKGVQAEPEQSQAPSPTPPADAPQTRELPPPIPRAPGRVQYSATLDATLHRAVGLAAARKHERTTLEHLLLALIDDSDAAEVMRACEVDLGELRKTLTSYVDDDLKSLVTDDGEDANPAELMRMSLQELKKKSPGTAGLHRVMQRAVVHVGSAGRDNVTGANVLVAIFSERESHAAHLLQLRKMDRFDAVNFIAHGIRKDGGRAA